MRRRRNQTYAGDGVAHLGDELIHFMARQLAAFTGLGTLGHLDLQVVGIHQVIRGDSETGGSDLLDGAAPQVAIGIRFEAGFIFPALARVGFGAYAIHGNGKGLVRFLRNGAERHGASGKALDDLLGGLDFLQRDRVLRFFDFQQSAQSAELTVLVIDEVGVFLERLRALLRDGVLQLGDGERIDQVILATRAVLVITAHRELGIGLGEGKEGVPVL